MKEEIKFIKEGLELSEECSLNDVLDYISNLKTYVSIITDNYGDSAIKAKKNRLENIKKKFLKGHFGTSKISEVDPLEYKRKKLYESQ